MGLKESLFFTHLSLYWWMFLFLWCEVLQHGRLHVISKTRVRVELLMPPREEVLCSLLSCLLPRALFFLLFPGESGCLILVVLRKTWLGLCVFSDGWFRLNTHIVRSPPHCTGFKKWGSSPGVTDGSGAQQISLLTPSLEPFLPPETCACATSRRRALRVPLSPGLLWPWPSFTLNTDAF